MIDCPRAFVEHFRHANSKVRRENLQVQKSDWAAYLEKWTGVFYDPHKDNTGGWIYSDYKDPYRTVKKFPRLQAYMVVMVSGLEKMKKRFQ